jgi:hypothetical protein
MSILKGVVHMWKVSRSTRRKLITILALLSILGLTATTAFAANPHFSGNISFSVGSLIAEGTVVTDRDVKGILNAKGIASAVCVREDDEDDGGGQIPAPNHPQVTASGSQLLVHTGSGFVRIPFSIETNNPHPTAAQFGCPTSGGDDEDDGWTVKHITVAWTSSELLLEDAVTHATYDQEKFDCKTKGSNVKCKPKKHHDDDD